MTLTPPPVDPAQPPISMNIKIMTSVMEGQRLKFSETNPVVVQTETSWNTAARVTASNSENERIPNRPCSTSPATMTAEPRMSSTV